MTRKKLEIKTRESKKVVIKQPPLKIKKRVRRVLTPRCCCYCLHWWLGPEVMRESGMKKVRICPKVDKKVKESHKCSCPYFNGDWVVAHNTNKLKVRDSLSPLKIKKRAKKEEERPPEKFIIQRRLINGD